MRSRPPKPLKRVNGLLKTNSRCHRAIHGVQALPKRLRAGARALIAALADVVAEAERGHSYDQITVS